ncbi:methyltransferase domain-containing protein [Sulfitobacter sp.]|uniref:methyltransferase domain-containing protein n=1 Tax=Sulfitobacter sp. TaxID=1903071 RepID=UPI00329A35F0
MSGNDDQRRFWSDTVGQIWIDQSAATDALFAPILNGLIERAELAAGHSVLDIGCGAGASTFAVADMIGATGHVTGIDISDVLLGAAQERAAGYTNVGLLMADAQDNHFVPDSADVIISRFGVMFFSDTAAAFANIASALRKDGRIYFATWGAVGQNPFFTLPAQVARAQLGEMPKPDPDGPGPFALRDPEFIKTILDQAGLEGEVETVDITLPFDGDAISLAENMCFIGPAQTALAHFEADDTTRGQLKAALAEALSQYATADGLGIPAQINYITARKPS